MDLEMVWAIFTSKLSSMPEIQSVKWTKITGIPFLYINSGLHNERTDLEKKIRLSAAAAMKGKQLHSETVFVRKDKGCFIYRHRFYVPQRKMFCCGNLCPNCIRFQNSASS